MASYPLPLRGGGYEVKKFFISLCVALRSHVLPLTHTPSLDHTSHITSHRYLHAVQLRSQAPLELSREPSPQVIPRAVSTFFDEAHGSVEELADLVKPLLKGSSGKWR